MFTLLILGLGGLEQTTSRCISFLRSPCVDFSGPVVMCQLSFSHLFSYVISPVYIRDFPISVLLFQICMNSQKELHFSFHSSSLRNFRFCQILSHNGLYSLIMISQIIYVHIFNHRYLFSLFISPLYGAC